MKSSSVSLLPEARELVKLTIESHCGIRAWSLLALNVRTNHVHVVVNCMETASPERAMEQFKAWSTRQLRHAGYAGKEQHIWAEHGSTRWINHADGLAAAIRYVNEGQ
jgi:REP element-mobilizing transposase RayT